MIIWNNLKIINSGSDYINVNIDDSSATFKLDTVTFRAQGSAPASSISIQDVAGIGPIHHNILKLSGNSHIVKEKGVVLARYTNNSNQTVSAIHCATPGFTVYGDLTVTTDTKAYPNIAESNLHVDGAITGQSVTVNTISAGTVTTTHLRLDEDNYWNLSRLVCKSNITCDETITAQNFNSLSDRRFKTNIQPYTPTVSITDLPIYEFDYVTNNSHHIGCLAQDLQQICPEIVHEDDEGYLQIEESKIVYLLLQEIKELKRRVAELEK